MSNKTVVTIRTIEPHEYDILDEFLYHAIYLPKGAKPLPRIIIYISEIYVYAQDFGKQRGDHGVVAEHGDKIIGMAWTRIIPAFGHVDCDTPELAISILPEYRGQGIGTKLMQKLFDILRENGYKKTSLSVQKDNPAVRFYLKLGYEIVEDRFGGDCIMIYNVYK